MLFAYADPPYPGKSRKYYGAHDDYLGEVDLPELIERLEVDYDGWALSTHAGDLQRVLELMPPPRSRGAVGGGVRYQYRLLSWGKTSSQPGHDDGPSPAALYGWEPVILRGGRAADPGTPRVNDWLVCPLDLYTLREKPEGHVTGQKPAAFSRWLFACAGLRPDDVFHDVFRGSGGVAEEWERFRREPSLTGTLAERHASDRRNRTRDLRRDHPTLDLVD